MLTSKAPSDLLLLIRPATEKYLRRFTHPGDLTVEAGCGPGQYRYAVNGNFIGFDISAADYRAGMPRHVDLVADARAMPFKADAFELVFFSNTFHYFQPAESIVHRAYKLLRSKGHFLIFDYSKKTLSGLDESYKSSSQEFQAVGYSAADWEQLLKHGGFSEVRVDLATPRWKRAVFATQKLFRGKAATYRWLDNQSAAIVVIGTKK